MNKIVSIVLLACTVALLSGSCHRDSAIRCLVISEAVHFELQPGVGTLNLPVFAGTIGAEKIVRDVSQAEYYYQKLSAVYGPKSFRFLADSTVELMLEHPGPLHSPQLVYGFDDDGSRIELSLLSFENGTAHYAFRVTDKKSGQVRNHTVDVPVGQSTSIGMLFDPLQNRGHIVAIALQALSISTDLTPVQLTNFLREKNTPRGVKSPSGFRSSDQRWMDDIFGSRGIRLSMGSDSESDEMQKSIDALPEPIGGMKALMTHFKYPESAKHDTIEGRVVVQVRIDEKGIVQDCRVIRSIRRDLDSAAAAAVREVPFNPAMYLGKPTACTVMIPIAFRLK
jgi:TonB family protein